MATTNLKFPSVILIFLLISALAEDETEEVDDEEDDEEEEEEEEELQDDKIKPRKESLLPASKTTLRSKTQPTGLDLDDYGFHRTSPEIHFENVIFEERREMPMPRNIAVNLHMTNIELHCSVAPGISKVLWTVEKGSGLSLTGTIYDNGRIRPNWERFYAMNRSIPGQNSLIILNATMGMAGTYRCATAYPGSDLESSNAELVVVSIEHNLGTIFSPIMYFKWVIKYCGNMKPHVLCSNGEVINGKLSESRFRENLVYTTTFTGCFLPDLPPLRCSIIFKDKKDKSVSYRSFDVQLIDTFTYAKRRRLKTSGSNNMLIRGPEDKVIRVNVSSNIEFSCDVHPPPDLFYWSFIDPFQHCFGFSSADSQSTSFPYPPIKFRLRQRFRDVSQLDLIDVDDSAAGQYRCVVTYQSKPAIRRTFNGELVVVLKTNNFVNVVAKGGRLGDRLVTITFRMAFRGNLLPVLICGSQDIKPFNIEYHMGIHEVFFNDTVVLSYIPAMCKIIFENQANRRSIPFEEIYVRRTKEQEKKTTTTTLPKVFMGKKFEFHATSKVQTPRNAVVRENTKNVVFHCVTDKDAITVTWEFDGVLQNAFSGLIYQNAKPLPKSALSIYRVNSSEHGQHSLTVLEVKPKTTGTYSCSVRFRNASDIHYKAELVMVTIEEPMTIELLPPGQKWQALFRCVISYYGRMQPFLRCADLSQNMGNKHNTRPGLASTVVFEKYMNLSSFPYSCEIHFRNSRGETTMFEAGQTVLASRFVNSLHHGGSQNLRITTDILSVNIFICYFLIFYEKYLYQLI